MIPDPMPNRSALTQIFCDAYAGAMAAMPASNNIDSSFQKRRELEALAVAVQMMVGETQTSLAGYPLSPAS
jgi:hypothetical protein